MLTVKVKHADSQFTVFLNPMDLRIVGLMFGGLTSGGLIFGGLTSSGLTSSAGLAGLTRPPG